MSKDNGGPAFSAYVQTDAEFNGHNQGKETITLTGMTLRDYFATKASDKEVDLIMDDHFVDYEVTDFGVGHKRYSITRQQARYIHADEMLEARK